MNIMYSSKGDYPLTNDLLLEFIQDAKAKNELNLKYEIEFGDSDHGSKMMVSTGEVHLDKPFKGQLNIQDESKNNYNIFSLDNSFKLFGNSVLPSDKICLLEKVEPIHGIRSIIGFVYSVTLGLDHPVTISVDQNGTDWTGYIGGIIFSDKDFQITDED